MHIFLRIHLLPLTRSSLFVVRCIKRLSMNLSCRYICSYGQNPLFTHCCKHTTGNHRPLQNCIYTNVFTLIGSWFRNRLSFLTYTTKKATKLTISRFQCYKQKSFVCPAIQYKILSIHYIDPRLLIWINLNPSMESNHIPSKVWDQIIYPFPNFNGATVEV